MCDSHVPRRERRRVSTLAENSWWLSCLVRLPKPSSCPEVSTTRPSTQQVLLLSAFLCNSHRRSKVDARLDSKVLKLLLDGPGPGPEPPTGRPAGETVSPRTREALGAMLECHTAQRNMCASVLSCSCLNVPPLLFVPTHSSLCGVFLGAVARHLFHEMLLPNVSISAQETEPAAGWHASSVSRRGNQCLSMQIVPLQNFGVCRCRLTIDEGDMATASVDMAESIDLPIQTSPDHHADESGGAPPGCASRVYTSTGSIHLQSPPSCPLCCQWGSPLRLWSVLLLVCACGAYFSSCVLPCELIPIVSDQRLACFQDTSFRRSPPLTKPS